MLPPAVSFDFDHTLATPNGRPNPSVIAKYREEASRGNRVYIVTAHHHLYEWPGYLRINTFLQQQGLPYAGIIYTPDQDTKGSICKKLGVLRHYDDNPDAISAVKMAGVPVVEVPRFE